MILQVVYELDFSGRLSLYKERGRKGQFDVNVVPFRKVIYASSKQE